MLKKQFRLKNKSAFTATYRIKNSYHCGGITLFVGKKKDEPNCYTRVGFVVSKKTHKRAVKRNRLKRLMRESYRLMLKNDDCDELQKYISLIFIGGEHALYKNFKEINSIMKKLIQKVK